MLEYLIDNIFVEFGGRFFFFSANSRYTDGYLLCTVACRLFLYSYEAEFVQSLLKAGKKHFAQQFSLPIDV